MRLEVYLINLHSHEIRSLPHKFTFLWDLKFVSKTYINLQFHEIRSLSDKIRSLSHKCTFPWDQKAVSRRLEVCLNKYISIRSKNCHTYISMLSPHHKLKFLLDCKSAAQTCISVLQIYISTRFEVWLTNFHFHMISRLPQKPTFPQNYKSASLPPKLTFP